MVKHAFARIFNMGEYQILVHFENLDVVVSTLTTKGLLSERIPLGVDSCGSFKRHVLTCEQAPKFVIEMHQAAVNQDKGELHA